MSNTYIDTQRNQMICYSIFFKCLISLSPPFFLYSTYSPKLYFVWSRESLDCCVKSRKLEKSDQLLTPNYDFDFRDFFGFKNVALKESVVRGFFRVKESAVEKARESGSGVGIGNFVNRILNPA